MRDIGMSAPELGVFRHLVGLTRDELATVLDVNPRTLRAWEAGRDTMPSTVVKEMLVLADQHKHLAATMARQEFVLIPGPSTPTHDGYPRGWWVAAAARAVVLEPNLDVDWYPTEADRSRAPSPHPGSPQSHGSSRGVFNTLTYGPTPGVEGPHSQ